MTNNDLINKIKRLEIVQPSESWLKFNREFLFKYIDLDENKGLTSQTGSAFSLAAIKGRISLALSIFQNRILAGSIALAAVFILVGSFAAHEAEGSLPGDDLYAVKTFMEKTRLAFAYNDEKRVALNFELAEKRLDEFSAVAAKKDENSGEVKIASDNLKNQLKVAAQELNSAKTNSSAEIAVSVAKIAGTKTIAYAKKLNEAKKELSGKNQEQASEVAQNIEDLKNSALAVLATNSKVGDSDTEEIAAKLKEKIISVEEKIDETQKTISFYEAKINEAKIKNSGAVNAESVDSLALSVKLISEARAALAEARTFFNAGDFSKTWDLLVNAGEVAKVAENVGNRVAVALDAPPDPSVSPLPNPSVSPEPTVDLSISPSPVLSVNPSVSPTPMPTPTPAASVAPTPALEPSIAPSLTPTI